MTMPATVRLARLAEGARQHDVAGVIGYAENAGMAAKLGLAVQNGRWNRPAFHEDCSHSDASARFLAAVTSAQA